MKSEYGEYGENLGFLCGRCKRVTCVSVWVCVHMHTHTHTDTHAHNMENMEKTLDAMQRKEKMMKSEYGKTCGHVCLPADHRESSEKLGQCSENVDAKQRKVGALLQENDEKRIWRRWWRLVRMCAYLLFTTYSLLLTLYYLLFTTYSLLLTLYYR